MAKASFASPAPSSNRLVVPDSTAYSSPTDERPALPLGAIDLATAWAVLQFLFSTSLDHSKDSEQWPATATFGGQV